MKKIVYSLFLVFLITAFKNDTKTESTVIEDVKSKDITMSIYAESITKVFTFY